MVNMQEMLQKMVQVSASDLHITGGSAPLYRVHGVLHAYLKDVMYAEDCLKLIYSVMTETQRKKFEEQKELDFSFGISNLGRFRANAYLQRGCASVAIRFIPYEIQTMEDLKLPRILCELVERPSGLILVTGSTGSGKSTTLAAMIDKINTTKMGHILTIEDPIEFVHKHNKCLISQREIHSDTSSFFNALRVALRQDPDYVLIGEMRDTETMAAALSIAETGHLTLATLHTNSAVQTISRIIDSFPKGEQSQVRTQLSFVLQGVISQVLVPKIGGGRVLATEILIVTQAIQAMIRDDKIHQIQGMIETGQKFGMHTLNSSLVELVMRGQLEKSDALAHSQDPDSFARLLTGKVR